MRLPHRIRAFDFFLPNLTNRTIYIHLLVLVPRVEWLFVDRIRPKTLGSSCGVAGNLASLGRGAAIIAIEMGGGSCIETVVTYDYFDQRWRNVESIWDDYRTQISFSFNVEDAEPIYVENYQVAG